jgi:myo-inositol-1(or 4)-monophosphatase
VGSVAWKLALVAAGRADATFTLSPKNEWDVAAGAALVRAAGGSVLGLDSHAPRFNRRDTRLAGLLACTPAVERDLCALLGIEPRC